MPDLSDEGKPPSASQRQWLRGHLSLISCGIGALALFAFFYWGLALWFVPHHEHLTAAQEATAVTDARRNTLAAFAAIGAGVSLFYTALRHNLDREARDNDREARRLDRESNAMTRDAHMTTRYTTAVEQLASDKLSVRLGGIYALERLARDSNDDAQTILDVLCAWVRDCNRENKKEKSFTDLQAALTVIGRFNNYVPDCEIDLSFAQLGGTSLLAADLENANLSGANLDEVKLRDASLRGASLAGAGLNNADIGRVNLEGAHLGEAWLGQANFSGSYLRRANFRGAWLEGANFRGAWLEGANFENANLKNAEFEEASYSSQTIWPDGFTPPATARLCDTENEW